LHSEDLLHVACFGTGQNLQFCCGNRRNEKAARHYPSPEKEIRGDSRGLTFNTPPPDNN